MFIELEIVCFILGKEKYSDTNDNICFCGILCK
jgi:hypothetical protein